MSLLNVYIYLQAIQKQDLTMKEASGLLGISYNILYQKYRDAFGKIGYKSMKQKCPDSENEEDDYSNDGSSDNQEDDVVNNSYVTRSGRRTRGFAKVTDLDNDEQNSAEDDGPEHNTPKKPYSCKVPDCSKSYNHPSACRKHVMRVHGAETYIKYYRTRRGPKKATNIDKDEDFMPFYDESDTNEQSAAKKAYACQFPGCSKGFTDRITYKRHQYYHKYHMKVSAEVSQISRLPTGPSAEELLAKEKDPEVVELQRKFSAQELLWKPEKIKRKTSNSVKDPLPKKRKKSDDPDWLTHNKDQLQDSEYSDDEDELNILSSNLRKFVMEDSSKRFKVRRAGTDFNLSPVEHKNQWFEMIKDGKKPCFATILGVKRVHEEVIDTRIVKFNGELLAARPLAWSFPQSEEEVNSQYDSVMDAYRKVLGMSEEELHCTFIFLHAQFGGGVSKEGNGYKSKNPKKYVKYKLSQKLYNMSKDDLQAELKKRTEEFPAYKRTDGKTNFGLKYDSCRIQFDQSLKPEEFEGLMLIAWHDDGEPVGKVLNFDDDMRVYIDLIRDVWMELRNRGSYMLPFTDHMTTCFKSVYERAFAPQLLQKLIDGTAPSRICPTCGKVFYMIDCVRDGRLFSKHIERWHKNDTLDCGCEGVDKIDTYGGRLNHKKLYHSNGKYVQCSFPECSKVIPKTSVDEHNKYHHFVNIFCELCGKTFDNRKKYAYHYSSRHTEVECKVCEQKILTIDIKSHMISHRGDPIPCEECGKRFPDERNLLGHMRNVHTPKEEMAYRCPYHGCGNGFRSIKNFVQHLNNMHFKAYVYVCEFRCSGAKYKDQSNLRAHYRKKHGHKLTMEAHLSLDHYLKLLTEEEQIYHQSILIKTPHYEKLKKYIC